MFIHGSKAVWLCAVFVAVNCMVVLMVWSVGNSWTETWLY